MLDGGRAGVVVAGGAGISIRIGQTRERRDEMTNHDNSNDVGSFDLEEGMIMCKIMCSAWGGLELLFSTSSYASATVSYRRAAPTKIVGLSLERKYRVRYSIYRLDISNIEYLSRAKLTLGVSRVGYIGQKYVYMLR